MVLRTSVLRVRTNPDVRFEPCTELSFSLTDLFVICIYILKMFRIVLHRSVLYQPVIWRSPRVAVIFNHRAGKSGRRILNLSVVLIYILEMFRNREQRSMLYLNLGARFNSRVRLCFCWFTRYMVTALPRHRSVSVEACSAVYGTTGW